MATNISDFVVGGDLSKVYKKWPLSRKSSEKKMWSLEVGDLSRKESEQKFKF